MPGKNKNLHSLLGLHGFPRARFSHVPTPFEPMERLSRYLGGPDIWVKRDDCTGLAAGGNKARKLEFLMGEALQRGADVVLTAGAIQSNHVRQTAAAAAKLGLACEAFLEDEVPCQQAAYRHSGNILLDGLLGCSLDIVPHGSDLPALLESRAAQLESGGQTPYIIPVGGSNLTGAMGYVACAAELLGQAREQSVQVDRLVHATGSGGTQAGLLAGFHALESTTRLTGISVSSDRATQVAKVKALAGPLATELELPPLPDELIEVDDGYVGDGYGLPTEAMREAVELCARLEGLLLDPVYSGKAMAGLIDLIRRKELTAEHRVVFLHTGGVPGLFAYDWYFESRQSGP